MSDRSPQHPTRPWQFKRFTWFHRLEHLVLIASFSGLCVTGLPQRFADHAWAQRIFAAFGGIDYVRHAHRALAVMLVGQAVLHVVSRVVSMALGNPHGAMLPRFADLRDAVRMGLYLVGIRSSRPLFDRYDFRQKFEYWAMAWGTAVMIATGLAQWFPVVATRWVPGDLVPVARTIHSGEALLAFLTIAIWHLYCVSLSADVFPLDLSIFTGHISEARMMHEHPLEYERVTQRYASIPIIIEASVIVAQDVAIARVRPAWAGRLPNTPLDLAPAVDDSSGAKWTPAIVSAPAHGPANVGGSPAVSELIWLRRPLNQSLPEAEEIEELDARELCEDEAGLQEQVDDSGWWEAPTLSRHRRLPRLAQDTIPCDMGEMVREASGWK